MYLRLTLFATAALAAFSTLAQAPAGIQIHAATDRPDALYHAGETATFSIQVTASADRPLPATVTCVLSQDGWKPGPARQVHLNDGKATVTGSLAKPGFLLLRVTVPDAAPALAGAAFDPVQIEPSLPVPDDFDTFWSTQKQRLAAIPLKFHLTETKTSITGSQVFDVQVDCLGAPVSGYFGKPLKTSPKSLPAILFVHGAGVRGSNSGSAAWSQQQGGMLTLEINAHGIPNGKPQSYYDNLANTTLKDNAIKQ